MRIKSLPARRTVLAGAAALATPAMGCSGGTDGDPDADPSHTARLRRRAAQTSRDLLGRYDATIAAHPALAGSLDPLRADVAHHAQALHGRGPLAGGRTQRAGDGEEPVPADPAEAVAALVAAEKRTADAHTSALGEAPGDLARLLASVAAAGAAHVYLLGEAG